MRKATNKNWQRLTAAAAALALCAGVLTGCGRFQRSEQRGG